MKKGVALLGIRACDHMVGWLGFMAYQPFVGYLTQNTFLCK